MIDLLQNESYSELPYRSSIGGFVHIAVSNLGVRVTLPRKKPNADRHRPVSLQRTVISQTTSCLFNCLVQLKFSCNHRTQIGSQKADLGVEDVMENLVGISVVGAKPTPMAQLTLIFQLFK